MKNMLNKYFSLIMIFMIFCTYYFYNNKRNNFVKNSQEYIVVLEKLDEKSKNNLIDSLKKLTFQDVEAKEVQGKIYFKIKCPPEKNLFFRKWILDYEEK